MRPPVRMACGFLSNNGLDLRPAVTTDPDSQGDDSLDCSQQNLFWCATVHPQPEPPTPKRPVRCTIRDTPVAA
jgi:hypothetical protein